MSTGLSLAQNPRQQYRLAIQVQGQSSYYLLNHPRYPVENSFNFWFPEHLGLAVAYHFDSRWHLKASYSQQGVNYEYPEKPQPDFRSNRLGYSHMTYADLGVGYEFPLWDRFGFSTGLGLVTRNKYFVYFLGNYPFERLGVPEPESRDFGLHVESALKFYPGKTHRLWLSLEAEHQNFKTIDTWATTIGIGVQLWKRPQVVDTNKD